MCYWSDRISCAATCWWWTVRGLHTPITISMLFSYNLNDVNYTHTHTKQKNKKTYMNMKGVWKMSRTFFFTTEWKLITIHIVWTESEAQWYILFMFDLFVYYKYFILFQHHAFFSSNNRIRRVTEKLLYSKPTMGNRCIFLFQQWVFYDLLWCILSPWYCRLTQRWRELIRLMSHIFASGDAASVTK